MTLVSKGWEPIGLGAISDVVQEALGPVDLDRSPVELAASPEPAADCPACRGGRFGFPGELGESATAMCPAHKGEADRVSNERFERAEHVKQRWVGGRAGRLSAFGAAPLAQRSGRQVGRRRGSHVRADEPDELVAVVRDVVEAAGWFHHRAEDLAVALGAEEGMPWLPEWMENLVLDLGRAGLAAEAAEAADALIRVDPDNESTYAADLGCALAEAGDDRAAGAQVEANLARWPEQPWVRWTRATPCRSWAMRTERKPTSSPRLRSPRKPTTSGCALMSSTNFARSGRPPAPSTTVRLVGPGGGGPRSRSARLGRNDPCFCGSGRKYKHCHGQQA